MDEGVVEGGEDVSNAKDELTYTRRVERKISVSGGVSCFVEFRWNRQSEERVVESDSRAGRLDCRNSSSLTLPDLGSELDVLRSAGNLLLGGHFERFELTPVLGMIEDGTRFR